MPTPLPEVLSIESYKEWIINNISELYTPNQVALTQIPTSPGIYFWFITSVGYESLKKYIELLPFDKNSINIDGYYLVYIGTAGLARNNGGDLRKRLEWHILQNHSKSAVCSGFLSTLRKGLSSLISDDLIEFPNSSTQQELNELVNKYFKIGYTDYNRQEYEPIEIIYEIKQVEEDLIKVICPVFNIKHNPNKAINGSSTFLYKQRRLAVIASTRRRLNCLDNQHLGANNADRTAPIPFIINNLNYEIKILNKSIIVLLNGQNIMPVKPILRTVIRQYNFQISLYNNNENKEVTTTLGRKVYDQLKNYYQNINDNDIESDNENGQETKFNEIATVKPNLNLTNEFPIKITNPTLIIVNCTSRKNAGGNSVINADFFDEQSEIINLRNLINLLPASQISKTDELLPAIERYSGHWAERLNTLEKIPDLKKLQKDGKLYFIIISAKYGVLEFTKQIPNYDFTIDLSKHLFGGFVEKAVIKFIKENKIINVFNFCSTDYNKAAFPNMMHIWKQWLRKQGSDQRFVGDWIASVIDSLK